MEEVTPIKHDAAKDIVTGQLFIFVKSLPIAFASNCSLNVSAEEIDISNKMCGDWSASRPGKKSFTLSSESLLTRLAGAMSFDTLLEMMIANETATFFFGEVTTTDQTNTGGKFEMDTTKRNYTGTIMITSLDLKSDNGQIASCSASFKGIGALEPAPSLAQS